MRFLFTLCIALLAIGLLVLTLYDRHDRGYYGAKGQALEKNWVEVKNSVKSGNKVQIIYQGKTFEVLMLVVGRDRQQDSDFKERLILKAYQRDDTPIAVSVDWGGFEKAIINQGSAQEKTILLTTARI